MTSPLAKALRGKRAGGLVVASYLLLAVVQVKVTGLRVMVNEFAPARVTPYLAAKLALIGSGFFSWYA